MAGRAQALLDEFNHSAAVAAAHISRMQSLLDLIKRKNLAAEPPSIPTDRQIDALAGLFRDARFCSEIQAQLLRISTPESLDFVTITVQQLVRKFEEFSRLKRELSPINGPGSTYSVSVESCGEVSVVERASETPPGSTDSHELKPSASKTEPLYVTCGGDDGQWSSAESSALVASPSEHHATAGGRSGQSTPRNRANSKSRRKTTEEGVAAPVDERRRSSRLKNGELHGEPSNSGAGGARKSTTTANSAVIAAERLAALTRLSYEKLVQTFAFLARCMDVYPSDPSKAAVFVALGLKDPVIRQAVFIYHKDQTNDRYRDELMREIRTATARLKSARWEEERPENDAISVVAKVAVEGDVKTEDDVATDEIEDHGVVDTRRSLFLQPLTDAELPEWRPFEDCADEDRDVREDAVSEPSSSGTQLDDATLVVGFSPLGEPCPTVLKNFIEQDDVLRIYCKFFAGCSSCDDRPKQHGSNSDGSISSCVGRSTRCVHTVAHKSLWDEVVRRRISQLGRVKTMDLLSELFDLLGDRWRSYAQFVDDGTSDVAPRMFDRPPFEPLIVERRPKPTEHDSRNGGDPEESSSHQNGAVVQNGKDHDQETSDMEKEKRGRQLYRYFETTRVAVPVDEPDEESVNDSNDWVYRRIVAIGDPVWCNWDAPAHHFPAYVYTYSGGGGCVRVNWFHYDKANFLSVENVASFAALYPLESAVERQPKSSENYNVKLAGQCEAIEMISPSEIGLIGLSACPAVRSKLRDLIGTEDNKGEWRVASALDAIGACDEERAKFYERRNHKVRADCADLELAHVGRVSDEWTSERIAARRIAHSVHINLRLLYGYYKKYGGTVEAMDELDRQRRADFEKAVEEDAVAWRDCHHPGFAKFKPREPGWRKHDKVAHQRTLRDLLANASHLRVAVARKWKKRTKKGDDGDASAHRGAAAAGGIRKPSSIHASACKKSAKKKSPGRPPGRPVGRPSKSPSTSEPHNHHPPHPHPNQQGQQHANYMLSPKSCAGETANIVQTAKRQTQNSLGVFLSL